MADASEGEVPRTRDQKCRAPLAKIRLRCWPVTVLLPKYTKKIEAPKVIECVVMEVPERWVLADGYAPDGENTMYELDRSVK